jgi:hypothetical protein
LEICSLGEKPEKAAIITGFAAKILFYYNHFRACQPYDSSRVNELGLRSLRPVFLSTTTEGDDMKQLLAVLVAAAFTAMSFAAAAQGTMDKKSDTKAEKMDKKSDKMAKKSDKKKSKKSDKKSDKMDKMDKK